MIDALWAKGLATMTAVGGTIGGAYAMLQSTGRATPEAIGSGAVGGAAISAAAFAALKSQQSEHNRRLDKIEEDKADRRELTAMHETLRELRQDVRSLLNRDAPS